MKLLGAYASSIETLLFICDHHLKPCLLCLCLTFRADHHSRGREHPSRSHRGRGEKGCAADQQRHADRGQEEVSVHANHR